MNLDLQVLMLVPLVTAILQIIKKIPKKIPRAKVILTFLPFVSMLVSLGLLYAQSNQLQIIPAITMGLMASGLYSGVKALGNGRGNDRVDTP